MVGLETNCDLNTIIAQVTANQQYSKFCIPLIIKKGGTVISSRQQLRKLLPQINSPVFDCIFLNQGIVLVKDGYQELFIHNLKSPQQISFSELRSRRKKGNQLFDRHNMNKISATVIPTTYKNDNKPNFFSMLSIAMSG